MKRSFAYDRMSDRELWELLYARLELIKDYAWLGDGRPTRAVAASQALEAARELRLRGTQGRLWG